MHSIDTLSRFVYEKTGKKIYWHVGSCCHQFIELWSTNELNAQAHSTSLSDCDIVVVGTKLSHSELEKLKSGIDPSRQNVIAFGNCTISGGIFASAGQVAILSSELTPDLVVAGCPPTFENFSSKLLDYLEIGSHQ